MNKSIQKPNYSLIKSNDFWLNKNKSNSDLNKSRLKTQKELVTQALLYEIIQKNKEYFK